MLTFALTSGSPQSTLSAIITIIVGLICIMIAWDDRPGKKRRDYWND